MNQKRFTWNNAMARLLQNPRAGLITILFLTVFMRLIGIASRPIWYDEAFSILFSEKGPAAILAGTLSTDADVSAAEEHPPAYYFLLWGWIQAFGHSLFATRSLSILAGVGSVALTWSLAKRLFDQQVAPAAALLAALLPFQVHYSQEVRMYIFAALWLTLAVFAFWQGAQKRSTTTPTVVWWALFALSAALAQYTHNLAAIYLILLALTPIFQKDWKTLRAVVVAGVVSLTLYSPWLIQLPAQLAKIEHGFWIEKPGMDRLFTLFLLYLPNLPVPDAWLMPALLFSTLIIALAAYQTFRAVKHKNAGAGIGLWLAYLSFGPPLLMWLVSQIRPIYIERALLPSHTIFCLWLAWALFKTGLPRLIRGIAMGLVIITAGMGLYQHVTYAGFPYAPYARLDAYLREHMEPDDIIVHSRKATRLPAAYFDPTLPQEYITDPPGSSIDTLAPATQQVLGLVAKPDLASAIAGADRVWFIVFQRDVDSYIQAGYETHPHLAQLSEQFSAQRIEDWGNLRVYLFARPQ